MFTYVTHFIVFQWNYTMSSTTSNDVVNMKPNWGWCFFMFFSCFLDRKSHTLNFTHWEEWGYLLSTWKHKYSLPSGGKCVVFDNSTGRRGKVATTGVKQGGADVAWTLIFCFQGVTHEWISSIFEMSDVFWIEVLSLCWSWYYILVGVELLADDVWFSEYDNTGFLSVGVDIFDR